MPQDKVAESSKKRAISRRDNTSESVHAEYCSPMAIHQSPSLHSGSTHPQLLQQLAHVLHLALQGGETPTSLKIVGEQSRTHACVARIEVAVVELVHSRVHLLGAQPHMIVHIVGHGPAAS